MLFSYLVNWQIVSIFAKLPVYVSVYRPGYGPENYSTRDACLHNLRIVELHNIKRSAIIISRIMEMNNRKRLAIITARIT